MADIDKVWQDFLKHKQRAANKDKLILHYLPLVKYVAGRLSVTLPSHVDRNDLMSSGTIGLISAIENFDTKYNTKFETYAIIRIKGATTDFISPTGSMGAIAILKKALLNLQNSGPEPWLIMSALKRL